MAKSDSSLSTINYLTGISDGLLLPVIPCAFIGIAFFDTSWGTFLWFNLATFVGAMAYGIARFLGEKEEIKHNHPDIAKKELSEDKKRLKHIGIDESLVNDMMDRVAMEQELWLKEVRENDMGWERPDSNRARNAGLQTALGFLLGAYLIALPVLLLFFRRYPIPLYLFASLFILFLFGWIKGNYIYNKPWPTAVSQSFKGILVFLIVSIFFSATAGWWA